MYGDILLLLQINVNCWNLELGNYIWNLGFVNCNKGRENRHKILEWLWIGSLCNLLHAIGYLEIQDF
jgi:hypothetical protein